ncbi:hypothetical protein F5Y16DRAFT_405267 [Xylariaceae sp. FL0255]|nr:hypothetical protein F5Y16DRAFT_405267 [Xylariaceae sp. FL0255]
MHLNKPLSTIPLTLGAITASAAKHLGKIENSPRQVTFTVTATSTFTSFYTTVRSNVGGPSYATTITVTSYPSSSVGIPIATTITVTSSPSSSSTSTSSSSFEIPFPPAPPTPPLPLPLSSTPPVPWKVSSALGFSDSAFPPVLTPLPVPLPPPSIDYSSTWTEATPTLPPVAPVSSSSLSSSSSVSPPPAEPSGSFVGSSNPAPTPGIANCGKGYTYCAFTLWGTHYWSQSDVDKAYCSDYPSLCAGGNYKTNISNAVFVCLDDSPPKIQLMCACGGTCQDNPATNNIAFCQTPCVNT